LCYFKACSPALNFEPALTAFLTRLRPDLSPDLLATDLNRGWMLMLDSGEPLRTFIRSEKSLLRWREILPLFTGLQKEMISHSAEILALGIFDRRLGKLPGLFAGLITNRAAMLIGQPGGLSVDEYTRLQSAGQNFESMCAELASFQIPATLHHDDFHDGNLFLQNGRVIFTDWGESALAHPFFSLVVLLRGASNSLDLEEDAPELDQMREWYLSGWTDTLPIAELRRAARLAERLGLVNRALTWHHVISSLPEALRLEYALAVPSYLQDFINVL
jgi:hypothetical protein